MSPSRIDELRRRVQNDPASIAFAQLAEEYRRSGQTDEAVRICREGLVRHPGYLSARVTLGRALLDLGQLDEARGEFEFVVAEAPENLAAVRGLAEIFQRDGRTAEALSYYQRALALARHDPEIEEIVQQLSRQLGSAAEGPPGGLSYEEAHQELLSAAERVPLAPQSAAPLPTRNAAEGATAPFDFDRLVAALGSPAAPPQLEAAVEGRAVPGIELPDAIDLGPNPFAALEAELRAQETAAAPLPEAPAWNTTTVVDRVAAAEAVEPEGPEVLAVNDGWAGLASSLETPVAVASDDPEEAAPAPDAVEAPLSAASEIASPDHAGLAVAESAVADAFDGPTMTWPPEPAPAATSDASAAPAPATVAAAPAAQKEDVLGDLESWLSTLHDRSTE